jgi:hypothetical protein
MGGCDEARHMDVLPAIEDPLIDASVVASAYGAH